MEIENQMQNHNMDTNSELIYMKIEAFDKLLIFIKSIGSDKLWFTLQPSEVL